MRRKCADSANAIVDWMVEAIAIQKSVGGDFVLDHPEDLGAHPSVETPGSIWRLATVSTLLDDHVRYGALCQGDYGASSAKPSRMMTSMATVATLLEPGPPRWTNYGFYLGPLRRTSSRVQKTIGRESRTFKTKQTVAWPNTLTSLMAKAMLATLAKRRPISEEGGTKGPVVPVEASETNKTDMIKDLARDLDENEVLDKPGMIDKIQRQEKEDEGMRTTRRSIFEDDWVWLPQGARGREIYIGRGSLKRGVPRSKWVNPFVIGVDGNRPGVINLFHDYAGKTFSEKDLADIRGKCLVCHCRFHETFHGDVLADMAGNLAPTKESELLEDRLPLKTEGARAKERRGPHPEGRSKRGRRGRRSRDVARLAG